MKRIHLILLIIYLFIGLYFAVFNWDMFMVNLNVDVGFTVINTPLLIDLFFVGLLFMLVIWGISATRILKLERDLAKKDKEISALKAGKYDEQKGDINDTKKSLSELRDKTELILNKLDKSDDKDDDAGGSQSADSEDKSDKEPL